MKFYKFSPIKSKDELFKAIEYVHFESYKLCKNAFNEYFDNAGNIGIFCHFDHEYQFLTKLRKELTVESNNPDQKYFTLHTPIIIPAKNDVPRTTYKYLYIRQPNINSPQVGDVDFYLNNDEYKGIKSALAAGRQIKGARIFDRKDLDMIELFDTNIDVVAYISTSSMTEKVRSKQSDATNL